MAQYQAIMSVHPSIFTSKAVLQPRWVWLTRYRRKTFPPTPLSPQHPPPPFFFLLLDTESDSFIIKQQNSMQSFGRTYFHLKTKFIVLLKHHLFLGIAVIFCIINRISSNKHWATHQSTATSNPLPFSKAWDQVLGY